MMPSEQPQLPSLDDDKPKKKVKAAQKSEPENVTMLHSDEKPEPDRTGYRPRRVDVRLRGEHANILHLKMRALQDDGARLKDGTEVSDRTKAILWILENEVQL